MRNLSPSPPATRVHASAVLFTTSMASVASFYEHVAGLRRSSAGDDHIVLMNDGFRLIVHRIPEPDAHGVTVSTPPEVRMDAAVKLALPVASLANARAAAARFGGAVHGAEQEWHYESAVVCDGWDPDGNVFQLVQET